MAAIDTLATLRDTFGAISGVASSAIGLEANIGPADYPLVRIVPARLTPGKPYAGRTVEVLVYFGAQTANSEGLELVYSELFALELELLEAIRAIGGRYIETLTDEDRLDAYKLMTIRAEIPSELESFTRALISAYSLAETLGPSPTVLAPFAAENLKTDAADWTINLAAGSITRELAGAASTKTRATIAGTVEGPADAELAIGIYRDGALQGNRVAIRTAGAGVPVSFTHQATASATGAAAFDVRATGDVEAFTFAGLAFTAESAR